MIHKVYNLRDKEINGFMPTLTTYVIKDCSMLPEKRMRPAVIVCPGGAYEFCADCESEAIALQFMAAGMPAFVLNYTVAPNRYPEPQKNLSDEIRLVRSHAEEWSKFYKAWWSVDYLSTKSFTFNKTLIEYLRT